MLSLLLSSALALPELTQESIEYVSRRTPTVYKEEIGVAKADLWVDPDGNVLKCILVRSAGLDSVAKDLCKAAIGAKLTPAKDSDGLSIYSLFTVTMAAHPGGKFEPPFDQFTRGIKPFYNRRKTYYNPRVDLLKKGLRPLDASLGLEVNLSSMPDELKMDSTITATVQVSPEGRVTKCRAEDVLSQKWQDIACDQIGQTVFDRMLNQEQKPVGYVRTAAVIFTSN